MSSLCKGWKRMSRLVRVEEECLDQVRIEEECLA